jgi:hypothetical protein
MNREALDDLKHQIPLTAYLQTPQASAKNGAGQKKRAPQRSKTAAGGKTKGVPATAAAKPKAQPTTARAHPCPRMSRSTEPVLAPKAIRRPMTTLHALWTRRRNTLLLRDAFGEAGRGSPP